MLKKEQEPRSAAEKGDKGAQIKPGDARKGQHPGRRVVSGGVAYLDGDPGCIAPGADIRQVGRPPAAQLAEAMAVYAALPDEHLFAAARARPRRDHRTGEQPEADSSCHGDDYTRRAESVKRPLLGLMVFWMGMKPSPTSRIWNRDITDRE